MLTLIFILFASISLVFGQMCKQITLTPPAGLVPVSVYTTSTASGTSYRISVTPPAANSTVLHEGLQLINNTAQCSKACMYLIETHHSPSTAGEEGSILHGRAPYVDFVPWGYTKLDRNLTVYCARTKGDCGATVPIHRHFKISIKGIHHAYSFNSSKVNGYMMEGAPLCYGWAQTVNGTPDATPQTTTVAANIPISTTTSTQMTTLAAIIETTAVSQQKTTNAATPQKITTVAPLQTTIVAEPEITTNVAALNTKIVATPQKATTVAPMVTTVLAESENDTAVSA